MRWPNLRAGLYLLVIGSMPFVWVVETAGCGNEPKTTNALTGADLVLGVKHEWPVLEASLALLILAIAALTPWIATRVRNRWAPMLIHWLGLLATLFIAYGAFMVIFFTLFTTRVLRPPGTAVTGLIFGTVIDAFVRLGAAIRTLWRNRNASLPEIPIEGSKRS